MSLGSGSDSIRGFDASITVPSVDWKTAITDGAATFAFIECVSGVNKGPNFGPIWNDPERSISCGAYQRLCSATSGESHAKLFLENFTAAKATLRPDDLPPVIDLENDAETNCRAPAHFYLQALEEWMNVIEKALSRKPIIYTNYDFARFLCLDLTYGNYPLWISHYNAPSPIVPKPWTTYAFWQHTEGAVIQGIPHAVDLDIFKGNAEQLKGLVEKSKLV
jgi:lysozyme